MPHHVQKCDRNPLAPRDRASQDQNKAHLKPSKFNLWERLARQILPKRHLYFGWFGGVQIVSKGGNQ
jgi:hypothetical protein